jgi:hypothetical protein
LIFNCTRLWESPQGDIGKLSNQDISDAIAWNGSEEKLVEALINAKWFDKDPTYRLIVHDWHEHCDDSVHMRLARLGLLFANGTKPKTTRLSVTEREKAEAIYSTLCAQHAHAKRMPSAEKSMPFESGLPYASDEESVITETVGKVNSLENKENGTHAHGMRTANALPSLAKPSLAMPSQAKPHLTLPSPDFAPTAKITEPETDASAILKSSKNGKAHEPSEPQLDAFSEWAHRVYHRHPKQKNQFAVLHALKQTFAQNPADQQLFDENHPLWITHWQLDPAYPRFVPVLAEPNGGGWINDQAWRHKPPPPPVADTKHARAKAWANQFKGETQ